MPSSSSRTIIIEPGRSTRHYWSDLWSYRELFYFLAWRDILVRYKQTAIGVAWALIRPFLTMVIFTLVFGQIAGLPSKGNAPYAVMVFAALLPWQLFANALGDAGNSLIANANMLSKIYFPRLLVPGSTVMVSVVDFLISFLILIGLMTWYQFVPPWTVIFLPFFFLIAVVVSMGAGFWLAALSVKYRDFRYVIPFIIQVGIYLTPVGFSSDIVPNKWRLLYSFNPMVGTIDGFRWALLGGSFYWPSLYLALASAVLLMTIGLWYFRRVERAFADII